MQLALLHLGALHTHDCHQAQESITNCTPSAISVQSQAAVTNYRIVQSLYLMASVAACGGCAPFVQAGMLLSWVPPSYHAMAALEGQRRGLSAKGGSGAPKALPFARPTTLPWSLPLRRCRWRLCRLQLMQEQKLPC